MGYMVQALSLARLALGQVSPNPAVGAVIVKNGVVVTQPPGGDHAEIVALKASGGQVKGGSLYVTLEPCSHYGSTPPCTDSIIAAGISEVHLATVDDNCLVAGSGRAALEKAGIKVIVGEGKAEAKQINEAYFKFITSGLPFVTAKYAMSLDGKIATREGDSRWISSEEARNYVHNMRYISDAVMVGVNTVLVDNPRLTARTCHGRGGTSHSQPLRVVIDDVGRMPLDATMFAEPGETLLVLGSKVTIEEKAAYKKAGATVVELPSAGCMVDLKKLMKYLAGRNITSLRVEGGGALLGSLFDAALVDKVVCFIAPTIIGGARAKVPVAGHGVDKIIEAVRLKRVTVNRLSDDVMVTGYVEG
jgi:diaminohydroxyphosphoribosylaminopyrimidine deaminase/5-amino-6-(5-phosphoribosylamino)uracil reductase